MDFRFGIPFLYAAMLFGNVAFLAVFTANEVWNEHLGLSIALFLCLSNASALCGRSHKEAFRGERASRSRRTERKVPF